MSVSSVEFLIGITLVASLFPLLPAAAARRVLLFACNALFLALLVRNGLSWVGLTVFLGSGFGMALLLQRWPARSLFSAYLVILLAGFVYLQKYAFLRFIVPADLLNHPIAIVGLSYLLFRQIHYLVDSMQGQLGRLGLWSYLNYQLNLFGLLAGPIVRYQDFYEYWRAPGATLPDRHTLLKSYFRIFLGVIKLAGVSAVLLFAYRKFSQHLLQTQPTRLSALLDFAVVFYSYPAYVYFNFSGYCDIVIGSAALVGLILPENFDQPYLARNMIDYWNRWHRTLSFWIRDYIFTPLYKALAGRWPRRAGLMAICCYFVALFLAGVWHGSTWNWVVFGLLNGIGVSAAKIWENYLVQSRGRAGLRIYLQSPRIRNMSVFGNIHFACFTILFFPAELDRTIAIIKAFWRGCVG